MSDCFKGIKCANCLSRIRGGRSESRTPHPDFDPESNKESSSHKTEVNKTKDEEDEEDQAKRRSKKIDREISRCKKELKREIKVLLLGAAESGKSTFLKQMRIIHGEEFDEETILEFRSIIYANIIQGMKQLIIARYNLDIPWGIPSNLVHAHHVSQIPDHHLPKCPEEFSFCALSLTALWIDTGIQRTFEKRSHFYLSDGVPYLLNNLSRISQPEYRPTHSDILHARKSTQSVTDFRLIIKSIPFRFVDVGGQRTQRHKWFQHFSDVTCIIFFVASSEYDQTLLEDPSTNRMIESKELFKTIIQNKCFANTPIIIFLNKWDILKEKMNRLKERFVERLEEKASLDSPETPSDCSSGKSSSTKFSQDISHYLPEFKGNPYELADVKRFMLNLFRSAFDKPRKGFYSHETTAVDTRNIQLVFNSVRATILQQNISQVMLD